MINSELEFWQRGPVDSVPPLLQPVAHALLQSAEDVQGYTADLSPELLWERPAGVASPGFHLLHIRGVIDRLFTYARGESLSAEQLKALGQEKESQNTPVAVLVESIRNQVNAAIIQLRNTHASELTEPRELGRKKIPTTVLGLLFHAAEHSQRHVGQLLVTVSVLKGGSLK